MQTKRPYLFGALAILVWLSPVASVYAAKPNVLFIAVDDLRTDLNCYGKPYAISPNIDRIAKDGIVFNRAYCQQAVCSPSRTSLMTGARPDTTKVWDLNTHFRKAMPNVVTLSQHFKNSGYFVQGMGKIYHGGFDDEPSWSVPWQRPKASQYASEDTLKLTKRKHAAAKKKGLKGKELSRASRGPAVESADVPDDTYHDGALATMAIKALKENSKKDKPFFLAVGFIRPHLPFVAPKKYWDLYDRQKIPLASNPYEPKHAPPWAMTNSGEIRVYEGIPKGTIPDDQARELKHGYYAATSYMDAQLGRILDELDRLKLKDNTIVILWGDHGWKLGEHGGWCKHTNFENDANAPLLISVPGLKTAGRKTNALVEFVDIYPTLCELANLPLPKHLEGTSFAPVLSDPDRTWKPAAFSQYPRSHKGKRMMGYSMRTDRYRFTRWVERNNHDNVLGVELYDHRNDPQENTNIAGAPENSALIKELTAQWKKGWQGAKPE